jgi:hypothetical protein
MVFLQTCIAAILMCVFKLVLKLFEVFLSFKFRVLLALMEDFPWKHLQSEIELNVKFDTSIFVQVNRELLGVPPPPPHPLH